VFLQRPVCEDSGVSVVSVCEGIYSNEVVVKLTEDYEFKSA